LPPAVGIHRATAWEQLPTDKCILHHAFFNILLTVAVGFYHICLPILRNVTGIKRLAAFFEKSLFLGRKFVD
jgi:hypothetical protein